MSTQILFDKLSYIDRLKAAGVDDSVARAHADGLDQAFREELATKSELNRVEASLKTEIAELKHDVAEVATKNEHSTGALRLEIKAMIADAVTDITKEIHSTAYKALGAIIAIFGTFTAIAHFWK